jgi:hypothetical protein
MVLSLCTVFLFLSNSANAQTNYYKESDLNNPVYTIAANNDIIVYNVKLTATGDYTVTIPYNTTGGYYEISSIATLRALSTFVMNDPYIKKTETPTGGTATITYWNGATKAYQNIDPRYNTYNKTFKLMANLDFANPGTYNGTTVENLIYDFNYTLGGEDGTTKVYDGANESNFVPIGRWYSKDIVADSNIVSYTIYTTSISGDIRTTPVATDGDITKTTKINCLRFFAGTFNGDNKTITGLTILKPAICNAYSENSFVGLFGYLYDANIKNLGVISPNLQGQCYTAGLTGGNDYGGSIKNCYVENPQIKGFSYIGGLAGTLNNSMDISDCYVKNVTITNPYYNDGIATHTNTYNGYNIGGVAGTFDTYSIMQNVYANIVTIQGNYYANIGGCIGAAAYQSNIKNCYVINANMEGYSIIGGFVGSVNTTKLYNIYSQSIINRLSIDAHAVGGLYGAKDSYSTISNCYYNSDWKGTTLSGITTTGDAIGCTAKETWYMKGMTSSTGTTYTSNAFINDLNNYISESNREYNFELDDATTPTNDHYPVCSSILSKLQHGIVSDNIVITSANSSYLPAAVAGKVTVTIEDGASVMDNTNTITNVVLKQNCRINKWNFIGRTINTSTTVKDNTTTPVTYYNANTVDLINNNFGNVNTTSSHLMVASKWNYTTNNWNYGDGNGITAGYAYTTNSILTGEGIMIYPLADYTTTPATTPTTADGFIIIKQEGTINNADSYNLSTIVSTNLGDDYTGTNGISGKWFSLSNPYTGRLNANQFVSDVTVQGDVVYVRQARNKRWKTMYEIYPGEGFMVAAPVDAEGNSTTSISGSISKTQLVGYEGSSKTTPKYIKPLSEMITFTSQANNTTQNVYARINEQASNAFDNKDAYVMLSTNNTDLVEPYFLVNDQTYTER